MKNDLEFVMPDEREEAAGFSAQTLSYPDAYELPRLGSGEGKRLERAVALVLDARNRIKRRRTGGGYVHEALEGDEWRVATTFSTLEEVTAPDEPAET